MVDQPLPPTKDRYEAADRFVRWLGKRVLQTASAGFDDTISGKASDRFWLGRLAPAHIAAKSGTDPRLERLEPCQIGFRFLPDGLGPWAGQASVTLRLWRKLQPGQWRRLSPVTLSVDVVISDAPGVQKYGGPAFRQVLSQVSGRNDLDAELVFEVSEARGEREVSATFVNTSSLDDGADVDPRFYEVEFQLAGVPHHPFLLDSLEDTFRFDRRVSVYGINGGAESADGLIRTVAVETASKRRPEFWGGEGPELDLTFRRLTSNPVEAANELVAQLASWGEREWSAERLRARQHQESWSSEMADAAALGSSKFAEELSRLRAGATLLATDPTIHRAFQLMNESLEIIGLRKGYGGWRPFQLGFLIANLGALDRWANDADVVDIVWFATGGGKTETYLGLIVAAAFHDRLTGKLDGCTAWSRFPLRLLSLQQMQRFADTLAAAEIVRRRHDVAGAAFGLGFLVGNDATPNKIRRPEQDKNTKYDPDDATLPTRFRLLQRCPFCGSPDLKMAFDTAAWTLEHRCANEQCAWPERALPFHVVDEEVFRFLPTVVVGTLDKAALIGMQQAMRGVVAGPLAKCSNPSHGYTYNSSSKSPNGCLVPDCSAPSSSLPFPAQQFAPSLRLQDELHLLRDSLGAVDAHYEAALDGIQDEVTGRRAKIVASSATLSGYQKQTAVLYRRSARVFPQPPPSPTSGFWTKPSDRSMREFVAVAPRGATVEFAVDRLLNELQIAVRMLIDDPISVCGDIGVDPALAPFLVDVYGTDVVYGNTLRDLEAVARSSGTQLVDVPGTVNIVPLTGRTQFEDVSDTLDRLEVTDTERPFEERIHVVTASSMMSHGVDIDRLNVMVMLGVPLTTAEFIQATARVGRRWPALVIVVHKMARERDAGVYRSFRTFVEHGDRLVEPIPITRRSRRVLERTLSGLEMARLLHIHAPRAAARFTTASAVNRALRDGSIVPEREADAIVAYLEYDPVSEEEHISDVRDDLERYWEKLGSPQTTAYEWFGNVWGNRPMRSLRDVEDQVPVHLKR